MVISVQFHDKNEVFKGREYDYQLHFTEEVPKVGDVLRLLDPDYNFLNRGTRVKVSKIKDETNSKLTVVKYLHA